MQQGHEMARQAPGRAGSPRDVHSSWGGDTVERTSIFGVAGFLTVLGMIASATVAAEQGPLPEGSPAATRTLDGQQLPAPDLPFGGKIERNALQSKSWWQPRIVPPKGAPNILLIMTDDTGFGAGSTFGGVIPMPTLDKLAHQGLRYTNMNSTALCSPSRAALITGRNHHSVGFGVVSEQATGFPGYDSFIP